ncbi:MAG: hypothetical protein J6I47_00645 [Ruminococcus sp.]|nr:hypothetical protein [Ruminococcus sp.]
MTQSDVLKALNENEQQRSQFNEVAVFVNDAFKKEMPTFIKLIQFDVLTEIQKKAVANGLENKNSAEKQLTSDLDKLLNQINKDLSAQMEAQFKKLQQD